jgi:hypothetical protein
VKLILVRLPTAWNDEKAEKIPAFGDFEPNTCNDPVQVAVRGWHALTRHWLAAPEL